MCMLGLALGAVRFASHQSDWALLFAEEAARLTIGVGDRVGQIEHVGSTAIPRARCQLTGTKGACNPLGNAASSTRSAS